MSSLHLTDPEQTHGVGFNCMCFTVSWTEAASELRDCECQCEEMYIFKFDIHKLELVNPILGQ